MSEMSEMPVPKCVRDGRSKTAPETPSRNASRDGLGRSGRYPKSLTNVRNVRPVDRPGKPWSHRVRPPVPRFCVPTEWDAVGGASRTRGTTP